MKNGKDIIQHCVGRTVERIQLSYDDSSEGGDFPQLDIYFEDGAYMGIQFVPRLPRADICFSKNPDSVKSDAVTQTVELRRYKADA